MFGVFRLFVLLDAVFHLFDVWLSQSVFDGDGVPLARSSAEFPLSGVLARIGAGLFEDFQLVRGHLHAGIVLGYGGQSQEAGFG